jgi:hypothetical protein
MGLHLEKHSLSGSIVSYATLLSEAEVEFFRHQQRLDQFLHVPIDPAKLEEIDGKHAYYLPQDIIVPMIEEYLAAKALRDRRRVEMASVSQQAVVMASGVHDKPVRELPPAGKARRGFRKRTPEQLERMALNAARVLAAKGQPLTTTALRHFCPQERCKPLVKKLLKERKLMYATFKFSVGGYGAKAPRQCLTIGPQGSKGRRK